MKPDLKPNTHWRPPVAHVARPNFGGKEVTCSADSDDNEDFFNRNTEPRIEIIEGLHREGQLATIAGPFGVGKSPLLANLTICLLNGLPFCGRNVSKRPVVVFDFETAGPDFRRNLRNVADRLGVRTPSVPDELEVYLEHDAGDEPATQELLGLVKSESSEIRMQFLRRTLKNKPNAYVIIDPLEMLFRIDTGKKVPVLKLYSDLRNLLSEYSSASAMLTFNMRKRDKRVRPPDLLTDPRGWLEEVCGTLDIANRSDVRLGMDFYREDLKVINGIRRGEEMNPLILRSVGEQPDKLAGFDLCPPHELPLNCTLSAKQLQYWLRLPSTFRFEDMADVTVPRSSLWRLIQRTKSLGLIEERDGSWHKVTTG
jgi:hypothetical protein